MKKFLFSVAAVALTSTSAFAYTLPSHSSGGYTYNFSIPTTQSISSSATLNANTYIGGGKAVGVVNTPTIGQSINLTNVNKTTFWSNNVPY
jgi:hypothetical protein